jgi:hypothetical protein
MTHTTASTPQEALIDYLRSLGCSNDEMVRVGTDAMSWHGAVYTAVESGAGAVECHAA